MLPQGPGNHKLHTFGRTRHRPMEVERSKNVVVFCLSFAYAKVFLWILKESRQLDPNCVGVPLVSFQNYTGKQQGVPKKQKTRSNPRSTGRQAILPVRYMDLLAVLEVLLEIRYGARGLGGKPSAKTSDFRRWRWLLHTAGSQSDSWYAKNKVEVSLAASKASTAAGFPTFSRPSWWSNQEAGEGLTRDTTARDGEAFDRVY